MERFYDCLYRQILSDDAEHMVHTFFGNDVEAGNELEVEHEIRLYQGNVQISIRPMHGGGYEIETTSRKSPLVAKVAAMAGVYLDEKLKPHYLRPLFADGESEDGPARYGVF